MGYFRSKVVDQARAWIGLNEADGSHRQIIDIYNNHSPLARGYRVQYTDSWCATFVSAVSIKVGYTAIIPTECGCPDMIALFQKLGEWVENDAYRPSPGDVIFYDWQDSGIGDDVGEADHVGIVESVEGNTITVIEGNKSDAVGRRQIEVNGRYIRGYGAPKYTEDNADPGTSTPKPTGNVTLRAGEKVQLLRANLYATEKVKTATRTVSGIYYLWDSTQKNGRIRITKKKADVGVKDQITGWVTVSDLKKPEKRSSPSATGNPSEQTAKDQAQSYDPSIAGTYRTTAPIYMRNGAGKGKEAMVILPAGTRVQNYGYYTNVSGVKWLYVQTTYNNIKYTGFCCGTYLSRQ